MIIAVIFAVLAAALAVTLILGNMFFTGMVSGILGFLILYILSLMIYLAARKKWSESKYTIEIVSVIIVMSLSVGVKMLILSFSSPSTFEGGFSAILYAVYSGIGGLAFEGLPDLEAGWGGLLQCIFSFVSLYAGIISISIISAKISYEIFSYLNLSVMKFRVRFNRAWLKKTDFYVFKSDSEDSLLLARSIRKEYSEGSKKGRNCQIIFTGEDIPSFDMHNNVHREIMLHGFPYMSYLMTVDKSRRCSTLCRLGLNIKNVDYNGDIISDSRIHFFAFSNDENKVEEESKNCKTVTREIKRLCREMELGKMKPVFADFYILSHGNVNYGFYENLTNEINEGFKGIKANDKKESGRYSELGKNFPLHIVSEADIASKLFIEKRNEALAGSRNYDELLSESYDAMILGFGLTGQSVMFQSYINNISLCNGNPAKFRADVFDNELNEVFGLFELACPMAVCAEYSGELNEETSRSQEDEIKKKAVKIMRTYYASLLAEVSEEELLVRLNLPVIVAHNNSCYSTEFIRFLDEETGRDREIPSHYNLIVISLGNDESNIKIANTIISDIKHEMSNPKNSGKISRQQVIAVNIRDENNYGRLNWSCGDQLKCRTCYVVPFGCRRDIYSYKSIIDESRGMLFNYAYSLATGHAFDNTSALVEKMFNEKINPEDGYDRHLREINRRVKESDRRDVLKNWKAASVVGKDSSKAAAIFMGNLMRIRKAYCGGRTDYEGLKKLAQIEHERWIRFHIAHGWVYADVTNKKWNEHNLLKPFSMLENKYNIYNIINVSSVYDENGKKE